MNEQIAAAHDIEEIVVAAHALGDGRHEARILQIGSLDDAGYRHEPREVHRPVAAIDVCFLEFELANQELDEVFRTVVGHLQPNLVAEAARGQLALERALEIVDLFLVDEQIGVARDPELIAAGHLHPGKQITDVLVDQRGKEDEVIGPARDRFRQLHQPWQGSRSADDRHAAVTTESILALERDDEVQRLVEHARKRVRRIECDRRKHGGELTGEVAFDPLQLTLLELGAAQEANVLRLKTRDEDLVEHAILFIDERVRRDRDSAQLLRACHAVGGTLGRAEGLLLDESGDANLEELVEIRGGDAQERQALEQRDGFVLCLFEHAPIEFEQGQLSIDVELRAAEITPPHRLDSRSTHPFARK